LLFYEKNTDYFLIKTLKMKKLSFTCCLIFNIIVGNVFAQGKQTADLFNKKIVSDVRQSEESGGQANGREKTHNVPMTVANSKSVLEKNRGLVILNDAKVKCRLNRVKYHSESSNATIDYDSENVFERSPQAALFAQNYDPYIGKDYALDNDGKLPVSVERVWAENIPATHSKSEFAGILLNINPSMAKKKIGTSWIDTTQRSVSKYIGHYSIASIQQNKAELSVNITRTSTSGESQWKGMALVNLSNGFIYEMNLQGTSSNNRNVSGVAITMQYKQVLKIINKY
jgi:hypothetical protein